MDIGNINLNLIVVDKYQDRHDALAYAAYLFSAYGLAVALTWAFRSLKAAILNAAWFQRFIALPLVRRWRSDVRFRTRVSLYFGLAINLLYAVIKLVSGVRYHTSWFVVLALYYAFLAVMRFAVLSSARRDPHGQDLIAEYRRYRLCGMILFGMNAVLSGMVAFIIAHNASYEYPGTLIFLMAAYTFYTFILAIVNLVRFRKYGSPLLSAVKAIGMTAALVSMLSLETAMLDQFGGDDPARFRATMIGVTGAVICAVVLIMSVVMIVRSTRALKSLTR
ncbi:MAG: hypothetical protein IJV64_09860 [Oscillospiraceae bacterium]|nr:hypothetical protein [Oscillospiraceae bacterium]